MLCHGSVGGGHVELLIKACLGAVAVVIIELLARTRNYYIAGLVPLFPTFALISHYIVGSQRTVREFKETVAFSMVSLLPYLVYLVAVYYLADRLRLEFALLVGTLCWAATAGILVLAWNRL
jgi:uncharacterized membrane protein (GlpM family)